MASAITSSTWYIITRSAASPIRGYIQLAVTGAWSGANGAVNWTAHTALPTVGQAITLSGSVALQGLSWTVFTAAPAAANGALYALTQLFHAAVAAPFVIIHGAQTLWSFYPIQTALMALTLVGARLAVDTVERQPRIQHLPHKGRVMARFIAAMGIAGVAVSFGGLLGLTLTSYKLYAVALTLFAAMDSTTRAFLQNAISTTLSAFSDALDYCIGRLATPPPHSASTTCTSGNEPKGTELPSVTQDELRKQDLFKRIYSSKDRDRLREFTEGLNQVQQKDIDKLLKHLTLDSPEKLTALGELLSADEQECYPMCYAAVRAYLLGRLPKEDMLTFLLYVDAAQSLEGSINLLPVKIKGAPNPEVVQLLVQSGNTSSHKERYRYYRLQKNVIEASEDVLEEICNKMIREYCGPTGLSLKEVVLVVTKPSSLKTILSRSIQDNRGFSFPFIVSDSPQKLMLPAWHLLQYLIHESTGNLPNAFEPNPVFGMSLITTMANQLLLGIRDVFWPFPPLKSLYRMLSVHNSSKGTTIDPWWHDIYHWAHLANVDKEFVELILKFETQLRRCSFPLPYARAILTDIEMPLLVYPKQASLNTKPTLLKTLFLSFKMALQEDILNEAVTYSMREFIETKSIWARQTKISEVANLFSQWIAENLAALADLEDLGPDKETLELSADEYSQGCIFYSPWLENCFNQMVRSTYKQKRACKFNLVDVQGIPTLKGERCTFATALWKICHGTVEKTERSATLRPAWSSFTQSLMPLKPLNESLLLKDCMRLQGGPGSDPVSLDRN